MMQGGSSEALISVPWKSAGKPENKERGGGRKKKKDNQPSTSFKKKQENKAYLILNNLSPPYL